MQGRGGGSRIINLITDPPTAHLTYWRVIQSNISGRPIVFVNIGDGSKVSPHKNSPVLAATTAFLTSSE